MVAYIPPPKGSGFYALSYKYKEMLETLPLMDNGEALTYLYKIKPFSQKQDFFPNCDFHSFDNDSGVMIYTKRVNN